MRERETMLIREAEKEKREVFSIFKVWFVKSSSLICYLSRLKTKGGRMRKTKEMRMGN